MRIPLDHYILHGFNTQDRAEYSATWVYNDGGPDEFMMGGTKRIFKILLDFADSEHNQMSRVIIKTLIRSIETEQPEKFNWDSYKGFFYRLLRVLRPEVRNLWLTVRVTEINITADSPRNLRLGLISEKDHPCIKFIRLC